MAAYIVFNHEVFDPSKYEEYRAVGAPTIGQYNGRFIARGGEIDVLEEGPFQPARVVIVEFENLERARAWYFSKEYQSAIEIRATCARTKAIVVNGL